MTNCDSPLFAISALNFFFLGIMNWAVWVHEWFRVMNEINLQKLNLTEIDKRRANKQRENWWWFDIEYTWHVGLGTPKKNACQTNK